jgi:hypothetical protein
MKTEDLLLYGGIGLALYLLFAPKTVAPGVTQVAPVTSVLPAGTASGGTAGALLTALASLAPVAVKALSPSSSAASTNAAAAAQAQTTQYNTEASSIFSQPTFTPVAPASSFSDPTLASTPTASIFTPVTNFAPLSTPQLAATTPVSTGDDSSFLEFENGDYPGAEMSGITKSMAGKYGIY